MAGPYKFWKNIYYNININLQLKYCGIDSVMVYNVYFFWELI